MSISNKVLKFNIAVLCALVFLTFFLFVFLNSMKSSVAQAIDLSTKQDRLLYFLDKNVEDMNSEYYQCIELLYNET